jgi:hydroxyethylthiazole kinase-like uncharacterized protein yjeF
MQKLYRVAAIREFEQKAVQTHAVSEMQMMQSAGQATFHLLEQQFPQMKTLTVVCGSGNNGGDGYVVAQLAHQQGYKVKVFYLTAPDKLSGVAHTAALVCQQAGVSLQAFNLQSDLSADVVVDSILGIGISGEVRGLAKQAIQALNQLHAPIVAVDIPSGLAADTGAILGDAVHAQFTMTFIGIKQGMLTAQAPRVCGKIFCDDLHLPKALFAQISPSAQVIEYQHLKHLLAPRSRDAHKGCYGHVLVVGGDHGMPGAVRMAGEAALRCGAGLVSVATRAEHLGAISSARPELMSHPIQAAEQLTPLIERASVVVLGPGLGQSAWSEAVFSQVMQTQLPLIVDADGLRCLSKKPTHREHWVLTPHPGEAALLLETDTASIQADRFAAAQRIQQRYGGICILKGAGTLVQAAKETPSLCSAGNPGMASAGMGDVLSGVLGSLVAQQIPQLEAAKLGVRLHAEAADLAATVAGERGLLASDLFPYLHQLVNP